MKSKYIMAYIYFLLILTISINFFYTFELIDAFFKVDVNPDTQEYLISAIALEVSWILLFIWFILEPCERKDILLLTIIPMIIANILHNYTLEFVDFILNIVFLGFFISLYFIGYYLLKRYETKAQTNLC